MHLRTLSGLVLFFSSCSNIFYIENTSEINIPIDELKPAEIAIDSTVKKIAIVLPTEFDTSGLEVFIDEEPVSDFNTYIPEMHFIAANSMAEELLQSPRFIICPFGDSIPSLDIKGSLWPSTSQLTRLLNVDAILIPHFTGGRLMIKFTKSTYWDDEDPENWSMQKYLAYSKVELGFRWNLIIPELQKVISKEITYKQKFQGNWEWNIQNALAGLTDPYDILDFACLNLSQNAASYFAPLWQKSYRTFFNKGHPLMKEAATEAEEGNWDYAIAIWDSLSTIPQPGISTHATYNLAVAMEIMGNYEESLRFVNSLWKSHRMAKAKEYIPILNKRKEEQLLIEQQMQGIWFDK